MISSSYNADNYYHDYTNQTSTDHRDITTRPTYTNPEREAYRKYLKQLEQEEFDYLINNKIIPALLTIATICGFVVVTYHLSCWWWAR